MRIDRRTAGLALVVLLATAPQGTAQTEDAKVRRGNVVFIHPDGTGLGHWSAGRIYWQGPDGELEWDRLPDVAVYRGHMSDRLVATSNAGATAHAFGYKVKGPGSYGKDGQGPAARPIVARSGFPGSILREAAADGCPIGVVNDGDMAEPGTGAYLAEVNDRQEANEIARQILDGRPGRKDTDPVVVLGGGERFLLPREMMARGSRCTKPPTLDDPALDRYVHRDPIDGGGPMRTDGRNLLQEAAKDGWLVIRTRGEFDALMKKLLDQPAYAPKVLGVFAADDTFNDAPEEALIRVGLVDDTRPRDDRRGRLVIWGDKPGTLGFNPPTAAEMTRMALVLLDRHARLRSKPFGLVVEVESTDNLSNWNNAIGTLRAIKRADDAIGVVRRFRLQQKNQNTLIITAADSNAGGLQVVAPPMLDRSGRVTWVPANPTAAASSRAPVPVDGIEGRGTRPFLAQADASGRALPMAIAWAGMPDMAGGIVARAEGLNAHLLRSPEYSRRFDNTDVYRIMYQTLFGKPLGRSQGSPPAREE